MLIKKNNYKKYTIIAILIVLGLLLTVVGVYMGVQDFAVLVGKESGDMKGALMFTFIPLVIGILFIVLGATLGKSNFTNVPEEDKDKLI